MQVSFMTSKFFNAQQQRNDETAKKEKIEKDLSDKVLSEANEKVKITMSELKKISVNDQYGEKHSGIDFLQFIKEVNSKLPIEERQSCLQFHELFEPIVTYSISKRVPVCDAFFAEDDLKDAKDFMQDLKGSGVVNINDKTMFHFDNINQKYKIYPNSTSAKQEIEITELGEKVLEQVEKAEKK